MKTLYGLTIALSAFLLFSIEPIVTKALLPVLGGSSAVWITALAFFQLTLLAGYSYSAGIANAGRNRPALIAVHITLLLAAAAALFVHMPFGVDLASSTNPQLMLFVLLATRIGLPFFTLSTTAPLLQAWFARREQQPIPYRLFALSNLFSLAALLSYPAFIEPHLALRSQQSLWNLGFILYAFAAAALTLRMRSARAIPDASSVKRTHASVVSPRIELRAPRVQTVAPGSDRDLDHQPLNTVSPLVRDDGRAMQPLLQGRLLWFILPAVASFQLAAVTAHLTVNVAAIPLLWVAPLAAYLLSFVLAFELAGLYRRGLVVRLLAVLLASLGYLLSKTGTDLPIGFAILFFLAELLVAAWFLHAELFALRPADAATSPVFYLLIAAGGAAGTGAVAILSPLLTRSDLDLPFSFALTAATGIIITWRDGWPQRLLWVTGTALALVLLFAVRRDATHNTVFRARNFYGSLRVKETHSPPEAVTVRTLVHGSIQHGMQWFSEDFRRTPMSYYAEDSGIGYAMSLCCPAAHPRRIGVVGLGAGTVAAYGRPGDQIRFFEINPLVPDIAHNLFTYIRDSPATVTIVPGDARLSLAAEPPSDLYDVLVIDAFSGDAIPVHLLTREALALYLRHLAPGGILAFHISNQYLDLVPVLARLAEDAGSQHGAGPHVEAREISTPANAGRGEFSASWILITKREDFFSQPGLSAVTEPIFVRPDVALWTDGYSSLLPILRWSGRPQRNEPANVRFVR